MSFIAGTLYGAEKAKKKNYEKYKILKYVNTHTHTNYYSYSYSFGNVQNEQQMLKSTGIKSVNQSAKQLDKEVVRKKSNPFSLCLPRSLSLSLKKKSQKTLQVLGVLLASAPKIMPHLCWKISVSVYRSINLIFFFL